MKNDHLVPPAVLDMIDKLKEERMHENARLVIIQRLETTRDFIMKALETEQRKRK